MATDDLIDELLGEAPEQDESENPNFFIEDVQLEPLLPEINLIQDDSVRLFVRAVLLKVKNFWHIPSSFSGKYHPPDERGEGGNLLHTKRVVRIVMLVCESQDRMYFERDLMLAAALLHDVMKGGESTNPQYDPMHPYTVDKLVEQMQKDEAGNADFTKSNVSMLEDEFIQQILRLIRCHLGKWSPVPETMPVTSLEWALHLADMIASHLHEVVDGEVNEKRWDV